MTSVGIYLLHFDNVARGIFTTILTLAWALHMEGVISGMLNTTRLRVPKIALERRLVGVLRRRGMSFLTVKRSVATRKCLGIAVADLDQFSVKNV